MKCVIKKKAWNKKNAITQGRRFGGAMKNKCSTV